MLLVYRALYRLFTCDVFTANLVVKMRIFLLFLVFAVFIYDHAVSLPEQNQWTTILKSVIIMCLWLKDTM